MNTIARRYLWIGGAFCLTVIALIVGVLRPKHASGAGTGAPTDVMVAPVQQKDVTLYSEWIGTLDGFENAAVKAEVTGYLLRQAYQEGALVQKGQLLFEIDPRPFQAALDQAEGQLAQATAQLANAEAVQVRTRLDVERYTPLAKEQAASQQDLDNATQNNLAAKAQVQAAQAQIETSRAQIQAASATVQAAKAAVETAQLNLGFTRLISPIDGVAGLAQQQVGALVNPASGAVTTVSTVDPIRVYFTASEQEYLEFHRRYDTDIVKAMNDFDYPRSTTGKWFEVRPTDSPYPKQLETLERVRDGLHGDAYFIDTLFGPYFTAQLLLGAEPEYADRKLSEDELLVEASAGLQVFQKRDYNIANKHIGKERNR